MRIRFRLLLVALLVLAVSLLGAITCQPGTTIKITSPAGDVTTASFTIEFELVGGPWVGGPQAWLNFQPLVVSGGPAVYTASVTGAPTVSAGPPLANDNFLMVKATREADGVTVTAGQPFAYDPGKASAYKIQNAGDCPVSGPLAHRRIGDYCLENSVARFVIQDVTAPAVPTDPTPRDLYSTGQFGGNIIDAVLLENTTVDNFLEVQPMLNVETVVNAQTIWIENDGQDGTDAIIIACGPDDLLDFANPSSQLLDAEINPPPGTDDTDLEIEACTSYSLSPGADRIRFDTEVENMEPVDLKLLVGEWMNAAGEIGGYFKPNVGIGEAIFNLNKGGMSWFAEPTILPPDRFEYAYVPLTTNGQGSYVTVSGVTVILHDINAVFALLGVASNFQVLSGQTNTYTRWFGVGNGRGNLATEIANEIQGNGVGTVEGCVTVGGVGRANAKVTVGTLDAGAMDDVIAHFVTDDSGCYSGQVEVPAAAGTLYGAVAGKIGALYEGGAMVPPVTTFELFPAGDVETLDFALPASGTIKVDVTDESGSPIPARVTVVGFDPSPEPTKPGNALPGFGSATLGLFHDQSDPLAFGIVAFEYTGADGEAVIEIEPGDYHVYVSRGTEYSVWSTLLPPTSGPITVTGGQETPLVAQIAHVIATPGFVSSDFHVHGIASADSQVNDVNRAQQFAGEGVDNIVATDHHVHKDYKPTIAAEGLSAWVTGTVGEEITTFDYGHFNSYPVSIDASRPSGGSTDWAVAAPPGRDFPSYGAYGLTPEGIYTLATTNAQATASTTVQINHIGSHFAPLKIDTSITPPTDAMTDADRLTRRLAPSTDGGPPLGQLFYEFDALELWNGYTRGQQSEFLDERIGIWTNLLDQGMHITALGDTDTHRYVNLRTAGARAWTAASPATDTPATFDEDEMAQSVRDGRVTSGQGIFVLAELHAQDGSGAVADLTAGGSTSVASSNGNVEFVVTVNAPSWAQFDTIEIYTNLGGLWTSGVPVDPMEPYLYTANPLTTFGEGDCDPTTTGDGQFDIQVVDPFPAIPGTDRWEATVTFPLNGLTADTWIFAVVKGTDGACQPMFPVFPADLNSATNSNLDDLVDGNRGEDGVMALGFTNPLFFTP
jgi:hypothetical protein